MNNWNILGHDWAVELLHQHAARGEFRHAYLLAGAPGLGKRTLALRFAQAINCATPLAPGNPCGACRDCRQIEAMQHPDLNVIQAEAEGGTLKVDQIREVQRALILKPYQAAYRVALFLRFHEANANAANALLKTLEEAPAHAVLILTAETPEQLLPTILSRCEILRLRPLPIANIEADLIKRGVDAERARLLAHISSGRPGFARNLIDNTALLEMREEKLNDLQTLLPASRVEKFAYADKLSKDKEVMRQTILFWLSYWRDVLLCAAQSKLPLVNIDRNVEVEALAQQVNLAAAKQAITHLEATLEKMERNVNARLLAEVLLLDLPKA
ncbi:MAG: DNA polymerase III subunit delta' [Anaerolineales bacterium]|nr:DNA polymerase III subunit delta' [Anaerolineales bacterium]MCZ2120796.1 DNA polymerase III subunit delta' [Anaerolineales bacterium]